MANRPEHPNTAHVKELVANGNIEGVKSLLDPDSMPISYLIIAASNLLGDSRAVGAQLSSAPDKRVAVIDMLCQFAEQRSTDAPAEQVEEQEPPFTPDEPAPKPVAEEKPKKRRRRTKAQIAADEAAAEEESAQPSPDPVSVPVEGFPFDKAFTDTQSMIEKLAESVQSVHERVETVHSGLGEAIPSINAQQDALSGDVAKLTRNLARFRAAFCAFEEELLIAGTIGSAAFTDATESWED